MLQMMMVKFQVVLEEKPSLFLELIQVSGW